jgi:hypothetical protein
MNNDESNPSNSQENHNEEVTNQEAVDETQSSDNQTQQEHFASEETQEQTTSNANTEKTWHNKNALKRGIAMLGFGFLAGFVRLAITLIAVFQFFSLLFAEKPNQPLIKFGQNLNTYLYQINQFLTVNSEMYPFPFADWPETALKE